ncbi:hypothetical protein G3I60_04975 [Streptomyces sp. SID13666]|uniref:hypothetical protein n=1 Tax=Streptomyces sp. SID13666 TaxID=2706054 RepID=UPI0013BF3831|nr:hypothetical protein [Streptomyces sp. SID13666]NEA53522.1 hypothetical protein [Streptomyces sp. SID13666]
MSVSLVKSPSRATLAATRLHPTPDRMNDLAGDLIILACLTDDPDVYWALLRAVNAATIASRYAVFSGQYLDRVFLTVSGALTTYEAYALQPTDG